MIRELPYACHNMFLFSEEIFTAGKNGNTIASINNVKGKSKSERTCVACVF